MLGDSADSAACEGPNDTNVYRVWINEDDITGIQWFGNTQLAYAFGTNEWQKANPGKKPPYYGFSQGFHGGLDLLAEQGTLIYAGVYGRVVASDNTAYGPYRIQIQTGPDTFLTIGHLANGHRFGLEVGDMVTPDTIIGAVSDWYNHAHIEFMTTSGGYKLQHPENYMPDEMVETLIEIAYTRENYAGTHFHARDDGLWQTREDQGPLIYNGLNLNVGQLGYTEPAGWAERRGD